MELYILLFFCIFFITSIILLKHQKFEHFYGELKRLIITPSPSVYSNSTLFTWYPNSLPYNLGKTIQSLYPINRVLEGDKSIQTIQRVSTTPYSLGIVSEHIISTLNPIVSTHISLVSTIGYEQLLFLLPIEYTVSDVATHIKKSEIRFGVSSFQDPVYIILELIMKLYSIPLSDIKRRIYEVKFDTNEIKEAIDSRKIHMYVSLCSHPNDILKETIRDMGKSITISGIQLRENERAVLFPRATLFKIPLKDYELLDSDRTSDNTSNIQTLQFPLFLIANRNYPEEDISRLFYTLFTKSAWIKQNGDTTYIEQMKQWNSSSIFELLYYDNLIHPSVKSILIQNGYIGNK